MKLKLLFALFFITISSIGFSQRFDYDSNSKIFFGLNLGHTWHTSDVQGVKDRFPMGIGAIFGGSINQNYGNAIAFDLRLRYLGGNWYGQDTDTTGYIADNEAVNNVYDTVGYAVQNFKSEQHRLSLELAIHANRLRERTGWDPYIFGGIGFTFSQTKGDLLNDSLAYDYAADPSGGQVAQDYQTPLDMNAAGDPYDETTFEPRVLPSLGIGLGYYFNSRFSIGLEHKSTFFSDDYFDGTSLNQDGQPSEMFKNDVYHYTSVYFRWYLKRRNRAAAPVDDETQVVQPTGTDINTYTDDQVKRQPPIVKFTTPSKSPHNVNSPSYTYMLKANIQHVTSDQHISFKHDGSVYHNFTFNPNTNSFQSTVQLKPGQNVFKLKGTNAHGSDEDIMVINYSKPTVNIPTPPNVNITDPSANPQTVNQPNYLLKADVKNIDSKNQLTVLFNGQPESNYNFTPNGANNFSKQLALNVGVNTFKITGTNNDGSDFDETTIIYREQVNVNPPIVNYTNPSNSPITVTAPSFNLQGMVKYVDSKTNVDFIQNGMKNNNFSFNSGTNYFSSNVVLQPGQNIFQLVGTNSAGSDQATVVINYQVASPKPPIVSILNPSNNPHTTFNNTKSFKASVLNVSSASQVSMTLNGNNFTSFDFDNGNGILTTVLPLSLGSNAVTVTGTNSDGTDSKQTTIIYKEPRTPQPPVVEYVVPSSNPHQTLNATQLVKATVQNVISSSQIDVNLNGNNISNFNFNANTHVVEFSASLIEGANTITITGTNSDGVDSETMTIIYRKIETPVPPVVTYIDPLTNPKTVYSSVYSVEAKVKYVDGSSDIKLRINGNLTNNFTYSTSSELMNFNVSLVQGANIIEITGINDYGQDVETTSIIYQKPNPVNPPIVNITNPSSSVYTTTQSTKEIGATVLNVGSAQDIEVTINGTNFSNFSYNDVSKHVQLNMNLVEGNNEVVITATNSAGSDDDSRTIIYNKEEVIEPPHVSFINPPSSGYIVNSPTFKMITEVINVDSKNQIEVKFNGTTINDNLYSFDSNTKEVHYTTNLTAGNNLFQVRGTNTAGTHQAASNVLYEEPVAECDDPEVTFNAPPNSGVTTNNDYFDISAVVNNADESDITLKVNGITIGSFLYNPSTHILIRKVDLMEGNNVVEIIAETDCGRVDETVLINYEVSEAPCQSPEISTIKPGGFTYTTLDETFAFSAAASNIENMQQLQLMVNGMPVNFDFDLGTHELSANINLNIGGNTIVLIATNDCGMVKKSWQITREECHEPNISLSTSPQNISAPIPNEVLNISGTISDVQSSDINVKVNGSALNFVYNQTNESFNTSINLVEGTNNITISATNNCGTTDKLIKVTYEPIVVETPPTVEIVTPSTDPLTTSNANENIVANTTNISTNSQISVTVNNSNVSFNFDASTETISFSQSLVEGNNEVVIQVTNSDGTSSDQTIIVYQKPVVIEPPVVTFFTPSSSPEVVPEASFTFSGEVTNLTSENQLQLVVNGQPFSGQTTTLQNGNLQFNFDVPVNATHNSYEVTAIGTNSAGTDQSSASIIMEEPEEEEENCMPEVGATFSDDHHSVTATSTLDLSNVVLKFSDDETQKFEGLTGYSITLSGTGTNEGKCIVGVWVKSGCNQSDDGPGYGEWVPNTNYDGECEVTPCDPPVLNLMSNVDVNNAQYTLQVFVDNVTSNEVSIKHNGTVVNCSYTGSNQTFTCNVTLVEGVNKFEVIAEGCETITENYNVNYSIPCNPVTFNRTFPAQQNETVTDDIISLTLTAQNHTSTNVMVNGSGYTNFNASGNQITVNNVSLNEGSNNIVVSLTNSCSQENVNYTIVYEAPQSCGPRFNPGNSAWQFCLVTPSGTYTRDDLANNSNFTYTGPASSVYFKPIAGGGDAIVGGNPYPVQNGQYYLFTGSLTVSVSSNHPGSMGHWQICIESAKPPKFGNGGKRPASPCENKSINLPEDKPGGIEKPSRTIDNKKEDEQEEEKKPNNTPKPTRTKPTRNIPEKEINEEKEGGEPSREEPPRRPTRQPPSRTGGGR